jgi:hypothetical protein
LLGLHILGYCNGITKPLGLNSYFPSEMGKEPLRERAKRRCDAASRLYIQRGASDFHVNGIASNVREYSYSNKNCDYTLHRIPI